MANQKFYRLKEGYFLSFEEHGRHGRINIHGLYYGENKLLTGWEEIAEFIALLETMIRRNLSEGQVYFIGGIRAGLQRNSEGKMVLRVTFIAEYERKIFDYDPFTCQVLASKLNKLLHAANKFFLIEEIEE